ncbi:Carbohydrate binding family 11 [Dehalobacter sp. DCA]|jgi:Beta-mannanase|uniref:glycoside hydrolase family 26 protein n=1 Tax=Dehalobacter sp. DCA TaxID=1147129 RepID=UPI00028A691D|nr:glycosyl hydrolase [Dehalobacter sp. DCA]AFV02087.1 Carbohydrate binding family 11 [Dehalobacter sp. DCA]
MKKFISVFLLFTFMFLALYTPTADAAAARKARTPGTATASTTVMTGAWLGEWASSGNTAIQDFNALANHRSEVIHTFVYSTQDVSQWEDFMDAAKSEGAINLITLQLKKDDMTDYNTVEINNGKLDEYFATIAQQFKSWQNGTEVWLRPLHEVNGDWYGWCVGNSNVNTNASYKSAYQRIVKIFRANGATNVKFVYNVNYQNKGSATYMGAYPGNNYVDYVSVDGYNWGTSQQWSSWQTFRQVFDAPYKALASGSTKPIIIAEIGSSEQGGSKAAWITDMKAQIKAGVYPRLKANIWFNDNYDMDCAIDTSEFSLAAFRG